MADVGLTPIRRGDPRTITVNVVNPAGAPVSLAGSTWVSTAGKSANSSVRTSLTVDSTQAAAGVLGITITGEQTRLFDLVLVGDLQGSGFGTIMTFDAVLLPEVTQAGEPPMGGLADNVTLTWGGIESTLSDSVLAILLPKSQLVGFVYHGANPNMARPSGYAKVEWQGTVHPINAISPDTVIREDL